jgi:glucuronoarabinoxylan endo-1,4-beta-xylanase
MRLALALTAALLTLAAPARAATITVEPHHTHQVVDGFGFSETFQRANILHGSQGLSAANQQRALDLLFSPRDGAGFSILRNGIGSSPDSSADHMASIEPVSPGSPDAPPHYRWDGNDNSQVWLSQQALRYGVRQIYADAWSAPGYMKSNGDDTNGGTLLPAWRQAYANYLVQYLRFYAQSGIPISLVGFLNEPDLTESYASMTSDGASAAEFLKVLGPTLARAGLSTRIACCDVAGWSQSAPYLQAILSDAAAARWLDVVTAHGYESPPTAPLTDARPVWESEWAVFDPWDPAWDDGTDGSGLAWAQSVQRTLVDAGASAFLYWWGASASTANSGLIKLAGDSLTLSKRFWAIAGFSRFVRPGAVRVDATSSDSALSVSAFRNRDGSIAVQAINTSAAAVAVRFGRGPRVTAYTTDATRDLAPSRKATSVPARAMVTYVIR